MSDYDSINATLEERGARYGSFRGHASITQRLKEAMQTHPKYEELSVSQTESLEMIAHKIGRIINGDPNYADSWVDIAGYAQLIVNELLEDEMKKQPENLDDAVETELSISVGARFNGDRPEGIFTVTSGGVLTTYSISSGTARWLGKQFLDLADEIDPA